MAGWALAASGSQVDVVARVLGIAGLAVAIVSVALNGYLWRRSGPALKVRVDLMPHSVEEGDGYRWAHELAGAIVTNPGRMPVVVGGAWLTPTRLGENGGVIWLLEPADGRFPVTVAPTGYCRLVLSSEHVPTCWQPELEVKAVVYRGDGRKFTSSAKTGTVPASPPGAASAPRPLSRSRRRR